MPALPEPKVIDVQTLALEDSARVAWLQASQLIMRLADYHVVDLDAEAAGRGLTI